LPKHQFKKVFIFLDTDKQASLFDILTTIDAFPEASIIKYENVTPEDAERIIYDAIFPRGPEGAKHTKIFINGHDLELTNEILQKAKKCTVPPFELSVIIDPRGAYTTASAAVAKTLKTSLNHNLGTLENKHITVLAGTGPVGQTATRLYASEKARVIVTSRTMQKASYVARKINQDLKTERVQGFQAQTVQDAEGAIANADIVLATGAAGTELMPLAALKKRGKKRAIIADINAIPPLGIVGLDSYADGDEVLPGVFGIGALAIGELKSKIEVALIKKAAEEPKGIYDYVTAYEWAKKSIMLKDVGQKPVRVEPQKSWLP